MPGEIPATSFADPNGTQWSLQITVGKAMRLKGELSIDVAKFVDEGMKPLAELASNPERLVQAVWVLVEDQAKSSGISPEDFGRSFTGDTLGAMFDAFVAAVIDFFPNPRRRGVLRDAMKKNDEIVTAAGQRVIANLDVETEVKDLIASFGNTPAS